jgi:hypothetical protein
MTSGSVSVCKGAGCCVRFKEFGPLSIESAYQIIHSVIIPRLGALWKRESANEVSSIAERTSTACSSLSSSTTSTSNMNPTSNVADNDQDDDSIELFLCAQTLKNMSFTTSWRWMRLLGFKF